MVKEVYAVIRRFFLSIFEKTSAQLNCDTVQDVTQLRQAMGKSGLRLVIGASPSERPKLCRPLLTMLAMKLLCSTSYASPEQSPVNGCIGMFARRS